ncbi:hypothetical protein PM082_015243 [Marasmius tenuissimus]|nr:hypothetical protein PM082_015243 [Marasmius tenuissimus]
MGIPHPTFLALMTFEFRFYPNVTIDGMEVEMSPVNGSLQDISILRIVNLADSDLEDDFEQARFSEYKLSITASLHQTLRPCEPFEFGMILLHPK